VLKPIRTFSDVPVIVLTVRSSEKDVIKAIQGKANAFIVKPFRQKDLMKRMAELLHKEYDAAG
jgi:two-component system KDP operon response regulator KdpE